MDYAKVIRLPQYFRNLHRLGEIVRVLIKHGFGDLVDRLNLFSYLETGLRLLRPSVILEKPSSIDVATRLRLVCEELGPTFIKFAQLVASRPDVFPDNITREFRKLQDKVPPFPVEQAKQIIQEDLKRNINEVFSYFDNTPLAAASIAQVHRAELRDGRRVVIKVQRPQLLKIIDTDVEILRGIAALIEENIPEIRSFSPPQIIEEFSRSLRHECDFRREASSIKRFARAFSDEPGLVVPKVYKEFSSDRVITEEYIEGVKADDIESIEALGIDCKQSVQILNRVVLRSVFEHKFFHADPHPGNVLILADGKVAFVDFGAMGRLDNKRVSFVLRFMVAILSNDVDKIVRVLHETDIAPLFLDEVSLKNQIAEILDVYLGLPLGQLDLARMLVDVFEVARRYGIKPPADLLLVGKSIATIEHIGATLDPGFDPLEHVKPYLKKLYLSQLADPKRHLAAAAEISGAYGRLLSELPADLRTIFRNLARDSLTINLSEKDLFEKRKHQNRMLNRALMTIIGIALLALGVFSVDTGASNIHAGATYLMIIAGLVILILVWLSIRKTGGTA